MSSDCCALYNFIQNEGRLDYNFSGGGGSRGHASIGKNLSDYKKIYIYITKRYIYIYIYIVFLPKHRVTIKLLWIFPPKFYWFWAGRFLSIVISCWCKKRKFVIFVKIHSSIIPCKCPLNLFRNSNPVLIHWCWITLINTCCRRVKTIINIIFEEIGVTIAVTIMKNIFQTWYKNINMIQKNKHDTKPR